MVYSAQQPDPMPGGARVTARLTDDRNITSERADIRPGLAVMKVR